MTRPVREFIENHYRHFNARELLAAAKAWEDFAVSGGKMLLTIAGAMSTAEIGPLLAEAIRAGYVNAICCTGANLEEDIFNLFAHHEYEIVPNWRDLSARDEQDLLERGMNRVTDTCIPESVMRFIDEGILVPLWQEAAKQGKRKFHHEYVFDALRKADESTFQIDRNHSWVIAAMEEGIPIWTPGWEDSTLGNVFTAAVIKGLVPDHSCVKSGTEQMEDLAEWYKKEWRGSSLGFFQVGGGIAGDFAVCVVPMLIQDLKKAETPMWGYFAQVSDAVTSYGGYSGAVPNEKITWGKVHLNTPKFMIESDATIVMPLIFAYLLEK